jgi:hypothetical protein
VITTLSIRKGYHQTSNPGNGNKAMELKEVWQYGVFEGRGSDGRTFFIALLMGLKCMVFSMIP